MEENKFKLANIFDGIVIPIILVLLIFIFAVYINVQGQYHVLGATNIIAVILVSGFAQMVVLGIPLVLGLLWNKWAGGAAGFIMGGLYYVANAGLYTGYFAGLGDLGTHFYHNFFGDISMLFYLVNAVVIGYMAGALNNGSTNFKRMIVSGLSASIIVAVIQAYMNYNVSLNFTSIDGTEIPTSILHSAPRYMAVNAWATDPFLSIITNFLPSILLGIIVPILAKVMTWYGIQPMRHQ